MCWLMSIQVRTSESTFHDCQILFIIIVPAAILNQPENDAHFSTIHKCGAILVMTAAELAIYMVCSTIDIILPTRWVGCAQLC